MIFCETASEHADAFDELCVFASQLAALGLEAMIGVGSVTGHLSRNQQFDALTRITSASPTAGDMVIILRAHEINDRGMARLRRMGLEDGGVGVLAVGRFPDMQARIGVKTKLSYVLGVTPEVLDVPGGFCGGKHHTPVFGAPIERAARRDDRATILLISPDLKDPARQQSLLALALNPSYHVLVMTDGRTKGEMSKTLGQGIAFYHFGELLPCELAGSVDACLIFSEPTSSYRQQALIADLMARGAAIVDCAPARGWSKACPALMVGPSDLVAAGVFISGTVLPHREMIASETNSALARSGEISPEPLRTAIRAVQGEPAEGPTETPKAGRAGRRPGQVLFVPTNGVGLGHAQRCSLIASEFDRSAPRPRFAAFPSCMRMLKGYGFDVMPLVSRSQLHIQEHENDLVNYSRLHALTEDTSTLVFDGGYVFDSIYRTIMDRSLASVWVRRGMWQKGQDNSIALDREKAFTRVIVPMEAFDELNESYSRGAHVCQVGPIVQRMDMSTRKRNKLRQELARHYGVEFKHLAVTMLGGGVAADRSAQIAATCALMSKREDVLHLLVTWPTATVEAGAFNWRNTRVVKTHHASALVAASDLYLSAVGYNSFHEAMYNRVPTIFLAQMNAFMDDQQSRAMAAVRRDCADIVSPSEMLSLDRKIGEFLDQGRADEIRANLTALTLPETGNTEAARLIMEMAQ